MILLGLSTMGSLILVSLNCGLLLFWFLTAIFFQKNLRTISIRLSVFAMVCGLLWGLGLSFPSVLSLFKYGILVNCFLMPILGFFIMRCKKSRTKAENYYYHVLKIAAGFAVFVASTQGCFWSLVAAGHFQF